LEETFEGNPGGIEVRAYNDDMRGVFGGRATESEKSL